MVFVQIFQVVVVLYLNTYFTHCVVLHQPDSVISAQPGDNVTLQCLFMKNYSIYDMFWYKQIKGQQPCAVVKEGAVTGPIFHKGYKNTRFKISKSMESFSLSIQNISQWDEAVYYCGAEIFFYVEFGNGAFLTLNGLYSKFTDERDYQTAVVIFQWHIIGKCTVWIIFLCIGIKKQNETGRAQTNFTYPSTCPKRESKEIHIEMAVTETETSNTVYAAE
ncbi:uncharacterized protein LOC127663228 [Xyrauchen texanus]|uniref:uncharacterized protein LOC127663228 n=1 Tax=Xyrauchen texanus TaxID=154827 RepID=UPI002242AD7A|nr:uncharacterized protein LOC127663228 [Xyrauchen texanus]